MHNWLERLRYRLELFFLGGLLHQFLLLAILLALISVGAGMLVMGSDPSTDSLAKATWWAFLRLTDPGHLANDKSSWMRAVALVVAISGLVFFVGALVAIMTQALEHMLDRFESGMTPVPFQGHVVLLGATDRTVTILRELVGSHFGVERLLKTQRHKRLRIVVLAREVTSELLRSLQHELGEDWDAHDIILRTGVPWDPEALHRVNYADAHALILYGADFPSEGLSMADTQTLRTIQAIARTASRDDLTAFPLLVAEFHDSRKCSIAQHAYPGRLELIASDTITSYLIAQSVRHTGLSSVFEELLDDHGNEFFLHHAPERAGTRFGAFIDLLPKAVAIGVIEPQGEEDAVVRLNPAPDYTLGPDDKLVYLANVFEDIYSVSEGKPYEGIGAVRTAVLMERSAERLIVLGWSHKVPSMLERLARSLNQRHEVHVLSAVPIAQREQELAGYDLELQDISLTHHHGDYTLVTDLVRLTPWTAHHIVLFSSAFLGRGDHADARAIVGAMILQSLFAEHLERGAQAPHVLIELHDERNADSFSQMPFDVLISTALEGRLLAQMTLYHELSPVHDVLFGPGGAELDFRSTHAYQLTSDREYTFCELQHIASHHAEIALGVCMAGVITLNPSRQARFRLGENDELLVLTQ
ncbi:MAG: hypothetical protein AAFV53_15345 [Myxococcota bacterium]